MTIVKVRCGWCRNEFEVDNTKFASNKKDRLVKSKGHSTGTYGMKKCPYCNRTIQASRKELTYNIVGRKRWKSPLKNGDVV